MRVAPQLGRRRSLTLPILSSLSRSKTLILPPSLIQPVPVPCPIKLVWLKALLDPRLPVTSTRSGSSVFLLNCGAFRLRTNPDADDVVLVVLAESFEPVTSTVEAVLLDVRWRTVVFVLVVLVGGIREVMIARLARVFPRPKWQNRSNHVPHNDNKRRRVCRGFKIYQSLI